MGKGLNKRHRQKRAEAANDGNLHKALKGKASPFQKLPAAPGKDFNKEHVSASLRELIKLKELAAKEEARRLARQSTHATGQLTEPGQPNPAPAASHAAQAKPGHPTAGTAAGAPQQPFQQKVKGNKFKPNPAQGQQQPVSGQHPGQQGNGAPAASSHPGQNPTAGEDAGQQPAGKKRKQLSAASAVVQERLYKAGAFDQGKKKTLKDSKKQFLERRKLMKKTKGRSSAPNAGGGGQGGSGGGDGDLTPAELKLKAQQALTSAGFGEVASAPLKVQLKRKHWVSKHGTSGDAEGAADSASAPSARMKKIFLSQIAGAQQGMAGAAGGAGGQRQPGRQQGGGPMGGRVDKRKPAAGGQGRGQAGGPVGLLQQAKQQAEARQLAVARERLRQDVVQAYKDSKREKRGAHEGGANMASLAKLVQRSAAATVAAQIQ